MNVQRLHDLTRVKSIYKYCYNGYTSQRLADFPATFNPKDVENGWYDVWEKNNCFAPKNHENKEFFKMILPPPNVTGILHLGHALTATIQDSLGRWHRMRGDPVLWVPGLDHAGIATQVVLEKHLQTTEGLTRFDIGRDKFVSLAWNWANAKGGIIKNQLRTIGAGLDWSREYFTMSEKHNIAVTEAFIALNERNMVYVDKTLINWSPALCSGISEIEVEPLVIKGRTPLDVPGYKKKVIFGQIAYFAYKLKDSDEELCVATTRPETIIGDVAVAVHPDDVRYAKYVGQMVWNPFRQTFIPVISDSSVDREFGTGAVKITPAHDHVDYAIAKKHNLEILNVIDNYGNMTAVTKEFEGVPRFIAREKILDELANRNLLRDIKDHNMLLPRCSRSGDVIEYLLKEQWYIKCKDMANRALEVVKDGSLKLDPASYDQQWYNWLENIKDWCVSRQLWWGHRIPAYRVSAGTNKDWIIARSEDEARIIAKKKYGCDVEVHQDEDVLDTWFSSAILPFAAMGWPNNKQDFNKYYPLTLMETGHDILFFWVARMVMLGLELTNSLPFKEILLHGILCDTNGKKMSKSAGNVIDPGNIITGISLEGINAQTKKSFDSGLINKAELKRTLTVNAKMYPNGILDCGVDALRMTLCSHNIKASTITFDIDQCRTNKFFGNKIWQVSKYILLTTDDDHFKDTKITNRLDLWILSRLSRMISVVDKGFRQRNFSQIMTAIRQFVYYEFCDFYVEGTKLGFRSGNAELSSSHACTLVKCLEASLRTLAPIAPYVTDDLYKRLANKLPFFSKVPTLLEASYPLPEEFISLRNKNLEADMDDVLKLILGIRRLVANISQKYNPQVHVVTNNVNDHNWYIDNLNLIKGVSKNWNISVHLMDNYTESANSVRDIYKPDCHLYFVTENEALLDKVRVRIANRKSEDESVVQNKMKV